MQTVSLEETICMNDKVCFLRKISKHIINLLSDESDRRVLMVKYIMFDGVCILHV